MKNEYYINISYISCHADAIHRVAFVDYTANREGEWRGPFTLEEATQECLSYEQVGVSSQAAREMKEIVTWL